MSLPTYVPTSELVLPQKHLAASLAASSTFQTLCGADDAEAAEEFINIRAYTGDTRPMALLTGEAVNSPMVAVGAANILRPEGSIELLIQLDTPAEESADYRDSPGDAYWWFFDQVGKIFAEMVALSRTPGYLNITGMQVLELTRSVETVRPVSGGGEEDVVVSYWQGIMSVNYQ